MLYSRLHLFKDLAAEIAAQDPKTRRLNHVGITDRLQNGETPRAEHYYELMLESCERLFDNELEQHAFEDQMRGMFGTKVCYSLAFNFFHRTDVWTECLSVVYDRQAHWGDRQAGKFVYQVKFTPRSRQIQVQAVFLDSKSQDLLEILKRERSLNSPTTQDQINSRRNAEKVLGPDENVFRIDWVSHLKALILTATDPRVLSFRIQRRSLFS